MKTLYDLVLQYKSDVEQRIKILKNDLIQWSREESEGDLEQQIAHWEATLKEIEEVLEEK